MPSQGFKARGRRRQSGATAVEFALIVLPLFLMLFGIIQYGFYFWSMQAGSAAVRDAARQAAVGQLTCEDLLTYVTDRLDPARDPAAGVAVQRTFTPTTPTIGENVTIKVEFNSFEIAPGLIPIPDKAVIVQSADSRVENVTAASGDCDVAS
jgi:Flp pilus assembly protein TadG